MFVRVNMTHGLIKLWLIAEDGKCLLASTPLCSKETIVYFWEDYYEANQSTSYMLGLFDENNNLLTVKYIVSQQAIDVMSRIHQNLIRALP
jgi:hypothetical protein